MIEINLLPGKKRAAKGTGMSVAMPDFKAILAQVKDPWLIGAVVAWVIVGGGGALLFITDRARIARAESRLEQVKTEKRRYDIVIAQKRQEIILLNQKYDELKRHFVELTGGTTGSTRLPNT